ncbi:MAG: hypothetical protein H6974_04620 [Gammaproteobacteria bacterium]|nr:hypothetical protein [Gammaproteobacteria bacterium]
MFRVFTSTDNAKFRHGRRYPSARLPVVLATSSNGASAVTAGVRTLQRRRLQAVRMPADRRLTSISSAKVGHCLTCMGCRQLPFGSRCSRPATVGLRR